MKFTNVKQLIIKFMGGGLINFPTRFLRWVKINGDNEDDGSDDSDSDKIDAFNGDYFFPAKHPFIGLIDMNAFNNIDWDTFDWNNPENNPVYTIDTPIFKTIDDVDSYMLNLYTDNWPINSNFVALYDIDELTGKDVEEKRPTVFQASKEDANTKTIFDGPYGQNVPIKLNINGKTFVTFTMRS